MAVQESSITGLTLGGEEMFDPSKASELFMRSCVGLQHFWCIYVRFPTTPHASAILRQYNHPATVELYLPVFQGNNGRCVGLPEPRYAGNKWRLV